MCLNNIMEMNFCRRCGAPVNTSDEKAYKCSNNHTLFAGNSMTVGVFFLTLENNVLLSIRGIQPRKGMLDSFGGFVDLGETLEQAAHREMKEELNLDPDDYEELQYFHSANGNYPYGGEEIPVLTAFYWTRLRTSKEVIPADDVAGIKSLPLADIDFNLLHDEDIRAGIRALQALFIEEPRAKHA